MGKKHKELYKSMLKQEAKLLFERYSKSLDTLKSEKTSSPTAFAYFFYLRGFLAYASNQTQIEHRITGKFEKLRKREQE